MMDSFERRLKSLPLAKPSAGLRDRIFRGPACQESTAKRVWPWHPENPLVFGRRVALGWAAVLAVMTGLTGFVLGSLSERGSLSHTPLQSNIEVRIVEAASDPHNFDLTASPTDFLRGSVTVEIESQREI